MSDDPQNELSALEAAFGQEVEQAADEDALYAVQVKYLGKKGLVSRMRSHMGKLAPEQRKSFGQAYNKTKTALEGVLAARGEALAQAHRAKRLAQREDLTMLPRRRSGGSLHPITHTRRRLEAVFRQMGFDIVDGPHVEHEKYNFDDLNIQAEHPARDMQDTFFTKGRPGSDADPLVLRTHTSPVQIRSMLTRRPPVRLVAPGTVFRRDDDATHSPMFHQIEGLCIDKGVGMADLKATLYRFVSAFFGTELQVRLRPSFFPFVEPGAEFDMQCPFCGGDGCSVCQRVGWIELGGSGMVHPAVLEAVNLDPEVYTGWAFGFGIDRMAMLLYGVPDLRLLFEGDVRFLEQFPC
ncbi:MAG: phenylalanine--tRNA ligase subunit alpha [Myxococcota bacterium]